MLLKNMIMDIIGYNEQFFGFPSPTTKQFLTSSNYSYNVDPKINVGQDYDKIDVKVDLRS